MQDAILQLESPLEIAPENTALSYIPPVDLQVSEIIQDMEMPPYLETGNSNGGGTLELWDAIREKMRPASLCGKYANKGMGWITYCKYYKYIHCNKWFCSYCGRKGGKIHKTRMARIIEKIGTYPKGTVLRHVVFTVPKDIAEEFGSRSALRSLRKMASKIIKKAFPERKCVLALHLFGDKDAKRYHPHTHILIFDKPGTLKMLPQKTLNAIREAWRFALQSYVRKPVKVAVVHFSSKTEPGKIKHAIKYISRPKPGPKEYAMLKRDPPLLYFCTVVLSGFIYISYFNGCRIKGIKDASRKDELRGLEKLAGEKITWDYKERISKVELDYIYNSSDYDQLADDFIRIHGP